MSRVDIGFSENCEPWRLQSVHFPNKIGGKPAWLEYEHFPDLQCENCKKQMIFLCQVYAPYEECAKNFHRTIFIFICKTTSCCIKNKSNNIRVFRSNVERQNKFYSSDPPKEGPTNFNFSKWTRLCDLCGCPGEKVCSKCKTATYCCREHQIVHWKESHKKNCGTGVVAPSNYLFPESELVVDIEELDDNATDTILENELKKFEELKAAGKAGTMEEVSEEDLDKHASVDKDKTFSQFRKRVEYNPGQVLRYERGGDPLWISKEPLPESIPNCEYCGDERQFEFQIMPQLLTILNEHDLDFGILVVYSCKSSCAKKPGYKREFVFKQDVAEICL